jgi:DNA-binding NarL/FixJ family response regulator
MLRDAAVKVFLADYSTRIRESVAALLVARGVDIVGQAATPQDAMYGILATCPDVVVLETQLEGGNGLQVLRAVRRSNPGIAFIVFSMQAGAALRLDYLIAGANSFLDKAAEFHQLLTMLLKIGPSPNAYALALENERAAWRVLHGISRTDPQYTQILVQWQSAADRIAIEADMLLNPDTPKLPPG